MNTSDEDLARAAAQGDRAAFAALVTRLYDRVFSLAFRLTGTRSDAQDLAQDVCVALPAKLPSYRGTARFGTWLYRVVVNAAHDRRRRQATQARAANGWGDWEENRQAAMAEDRAQLDWLSWAMSQLPEDLRDTAVLVLEPLTQAEVAEILGISEGTVAWRMSEVKKRLKAIREAEDDR